MSPRDKEGWKGRLTQGEENGASDMVRIGRGFGDRCGMNWFEIGRCKDMKLEGVECE